MAGFREAEHITMDMLNCQFNFVTIIQPRFIFQNQYLERLKAIRKALNTSLFFKTHEVRIDIIFNLLQKLV